MSKRDNIDDFLEKLEFMNWVAKLNYVYRVQYRTECAKNKCKVDWDNGYYEFLLRKESRT